VQSPGSCKILQVRKHLSQSQQAPSLLGRLLADKPLGELKTLRARLRGEIEADRAALGQKETDLRELDAVIAERSGERARPVAKAKTKRRNGTGPVSGSLRQVILEIVRNDPGPWRRDDLLHELEALGAAPGGKNPTNTLAVRLNEMAGRGELKRVGRAYTRNDEEVPAM
jgi:hypothetical protein